MKGLRYTFDNKMGDGFFPIRFDDLKATIHYLERVRDGYLEIDDTVIDSIPLQHPQGGVGFRFREGDKRLVFITDNELREDAGIGRTPKEYSTFCKNADILIHDSQYTPEEINDRRGWGHSDYRSTYELARDSDVKRLILFHHDPPRTDNGVKEIVDICRELSKKDHCDLEIDAAKENSKLEL